MNPIPSTDIRYHDIDILPTKAERGKILRYLAMHPHIYYAAIEDIVSYYDTNGEALFLMLLHNVHTGKIKPTPIIKDILKKTEPSQYSVWCSFTNDEETLDDDFETAKIHYVHDLTEDKEILLNTLNNAIQLRTDELYWNQALAQSLSHIASEIKRLNTMKDPEWKLIECLCKDISYLSILDSLVNISSEITELSDSSAIPECYRVMYPLFLENLFCDRGSLYNILQKTPNGLEEIALHI